MVAIRSDGGLFQGNQIKPYYIIKNQTIMKIVSVLGKTLYNSEKKLVKDAVYDALESGADLGYANLSGADLGYANLSGADLSGAYLRGADLSGAKNIPYIPLSCPSKGSFTAWKKVGGKLIELEIPADARRSSATTNRCRCDKAKVISITDIATNEQIAEVINYKFGRTLYKVGEMVYPDAFDEDRYRECSNGIHFFIDKQLAINY